MTLKGLRLGQMLEERAPERSLTDDSAPEDSGNSSGDNIILSQPVAALELSVRARKCLQKLNINTINELVDRTEAELLGCKNFGMTSLTEIKQRLGDYNLSLRLLEE